MVVIGYLLLLVRRREHILWAISLARVPGWMVSGSLEDRKKIVPIWSVVLVEVLDIQLLTVPRVAMPSLMVNVFISFADGHCPLQMLMWQSCQWAVQPDPPMERQTNLKGPRRPSFKNFLNCACVCACTCVCAHACIWRTENNFLYYFSLCTVWVCGFNLMCLGKDSYPMRHFLTQRRPF